MVQPLSRILRRPVVHDTCVTVLFLVLGTLLAQLLNAALVNITNISFLYVLVVVFIARYTTSYLYGIIGSLLSIVCINFFFTYPYMHLNFTMDGYPFAFLVMLIVSFVTSATTTNLKKQARILAEREKELAAADNEKTRANLLRAISHDLRTPLTSIIGSANLYLENGAMMQEAEKFTLIHNIQEDANWLLNMVENILSVTRINTADAKVTKTAEPVEEVVSEAVIRLKKRITDADIHVKVPDDFLMIPMDAMLIEQVIINLLENAIIHSRSEKPIDCFVTCDERYVTFHVRDYGIGIPEDKLATIFDGTGSSSNSDSSRGMGIGLSICKTIVAAHDGTITACNIPGEVPTGHHFRHTTPAPCGAEFSFTLPRRDYSHTASEEPL